MIMRIAYMRASFIFTAFIYLTNAYRLNVPKALLPFNPIFAPNFTLEVSDPSDGCFTWHSSRPSSVTVMIDGKECASSATISTTISDIARLPINAVVEATLHNGNARLRCDVTIDRIHKFEIESTAKRIYLDDAPQEFIIRALTEDDERFSTIGGTAFDWTVESLASIGGDSRPVIRLQTFTQSLYESPPAIGILESKGLKGSQILIEGIGTGRARLAASLLNARALTGQDSLPMASIDLLVMAYMRMYPEDCIYVPVHSQVHFTVTKTTRGEETEILMPSANYKITIADDQIAIIEEATSTLTSLKLGQTDVSLIDQNMHLALHNEMHKLYYEDTTRTHIVVTDVASIKIDTQSIILTNSSQTVRIFLQDQSGHNIFIPMNAKIATDFPEDYYRVVKKTSNGSFIVSSTLANPGSVIIKAQYDGIVDKNGDILSPTNKIKTEKTIKIVDPLRIVTPKKIAITNLSQIEQKYVYAMRTTGGSGVHSWSIDDIRIANIGINDGQLTSDCNIEGNAIITVRDTHLTELFDTAEVIVAPISRLNFVKSHFESLVNKTLVLHLAAYTKDDVPLIDCTKVPFDIRIDHTTFFDNPKIKPVGLDSVGEGGCAFIGLSSLSVGDTEITVVLKERPEIYVKQTISAFAPLKILGSIDRLTMLGSTSLVHFTGGPKPWILDSSRYYSTLTQSTNSKIQIDARGSADSKFFSVVCSNERAKITLELIVGNEPTLSNSMPVSVKTTMIICCSVLKRFNIEPILPARSEKNLPPCPHDRLLYIAHMGSPLNMGIRAYGFCEDSENLEREFESFDSLLFDWSTNDTSLLSCQGRSGPKNPIYVSGRALPPYFEQPFDTHSKIGTITVSVEAHEYSDPSCRKVDKGCKHKLSHLSAQANVQLCDYMQLVNVGDQNTIMYNDVRDKRLIDIAHGSGHFYAKMTGKQISQSIIYVTAFGSGVELTPVRAGNVQLKVFDLCMRSPGPLEINVFIADIAKVNVSGAKQLQIGREGVLIVQIFDINDRQFPPSIVNLMELNAYADNEQTLLLGSIQQSDKGKLVLPIKGFMSGETRVTVVARGKGSRDVGSNAHIVQVFEKLSVHPKHVTLLTGSKFQLDITGGPRSAVRMRFNLNDSRIATVEDNGLITAEKLGHASIECIIHDLGQGELLKESIYVHIVTMHDVRIHAPIHTIHTDSTLPLYAQALHDYNNVEALDNSPYVYGGLPDQQAITFEWSISDDSTAYLASVYQHFSLIENRRNLFAVRLHSRQEAGEITIKLTATMSSYHGSAKFTDSLRIFIERPLAILQPRLAPIMHSSINHLLVSTNTQVQLIVNRSRSTTSALYNIVDMEPTDDSVFSCDLNGRCYSGTKHGETSLILRAKRTNSNDFETMVIGVRVAPVAYLMQSAAPSPSWTHRLTDKSVALTALPIGSTIGSQITAHDKFGNRFHATAQTIRVRPHRFDLTETVVDARLTDIFNSSTSVETYSVSTGDTVQGVHTLSGSAVMSDYTRFAARNIVTPPIKQIVRSTVACLSTPIDSDNTAWTSNKERAEQKGTDAIQFVDSKRGVMVAKTVGFNYITLNYQNEQLTQFKVDVRPAHILSWAADIPTHAHYIGNTGTYRMFTRLSDGDTAPGCVPDDLRNVASQISQLAPFKCLIDWNGVTNSTRPIHTLFDVGAIFDAETMQYGCEISAKKETLDSFTWLQLPESGIKVLVRAQDISDNIIQATLPYYPDIITSPSDEINLNDVYHANSLLKVYSSQNLASYIDVQSNNKYLLHVKKMAQSTPSEHQGIAIQEYQIELQTHRLDAESDTRALEVIVSCSTTSRTFTLPIKIELLSPLSKTLIGARESILSKMMKDYFLAVLMFVLPLVVFIFGLKYYNSSDRLVDIQQTVRSTPIKSGEKPRFPYRENSNQSASGPSSLWSTLKGSNRVVEQDVTPISTWRTKTPSPLAHQQSLINRQKRSPLDKSSLD